MKLIRFFAPLLLLFTAQCTFKDPLNNDSTKGPNTYQKITGEDTDDEKEKWNTLFKTDRYVFGKEPTPFLRENVQMLPKGRALVMPMEEGRNAVFLARQGFSVSGVDFSEIALQKAGKLAKEFNVKVTGINADLNTYVIEKNAFDVIVTIDFHRPRLIGQIKQGLKKHGIALYQVVSQDISAKDSNLSTRDADPRPGEVKELFKDFQILVYQENIQGADRVTNLIAKKP